MSRMTPRSRLGWGTSDSFDPILKLLARRFPDAEQVLFAADEQPAVGHRRGGTHDLAEGVLRQEPEARGRRVDVSRAVLADHVDLAVDEDGRGGDVARVQALLDPDLFPG